MNTRLSRLSLIAHSVLTLVGLSGIPALFLPFAWGISPIDALLDVLSTTSGAGALTLALPFFLAPFAVAFSLWWILAGALPRAARVFAYAVSAAAATAMLSHVFLAVVITQEADLESVQDWLPLVMYLAALLIGAGLLIRNSRKSASGAFTPVMAIQIAYVSNGVLCLVAFSDAWEAGAYCVLAAAAAFILQSALISMQRSASGANSQSP